jgi:voltage-gated potassium channel
LAALATVFLTVMAGAVQSTVNTRHFATFWDGVWWAVVTVTTVGYGDLYPHTTTGRIIGIGVMVFGIGFLAVLTATIASHFVQVDQQSETSEVLQTLHRIEADVAELKTQLAARQ